MERRSLREIIVFLKNNLPVENYFSLLLIGLIVVLLSIVGLTSEDERFIKNLFVYYIIVIFIILIVIMQTSLRLRRAEQKVVRYKNLTPSKKLQDIIRENIMGVKAENDLKAARGFRSGYFDKLPHESDRFYTPKGDFMSSNVRYRPGPMRKQYFGDSPSRDRFNVDKRFNTPTKSRFEETGFSRPFDVFGKDMYQNSGIYSNVFNKSSKHDYDNSFAPRYSYQTSRLDKSVEPRRKDFLGLEGKFKDLPSTKELEDYENKELSKDKYSETIEKLQIKHRMRGWMKHTKEWIQEGVLQKLIKLDLDNWTDLCRVFSRFKYNVVFSKEDFYNKETRGILPYEYDKIFKHYFNQSYNLIDLKDLNEIRKRQSPVGELYDKYFFTFRDGNILKIDESYTNTLENLLKQRKDIERYFNIDRFSSESRLYVYQRIEQLSRSSELLIKYNYGEPFNGVEWTPRLPTDAHIIMWVFRACFECNNVEDDSGYSKISKIYYDFMDYRTKYQNDEDVLAILQVAPHTYAPFYKVISGTEELNCIPGSDNVFNAILFFLYMLNNKKNSTEKSSHLAILADIFR